MKIITNFFLVLLLVVEIVCFPSCQRILDVDFSDQKPKIVLNGLISPGEVVEIKVSRSYSFLDTDAKSALLTGAKLHLYINDKLEEEMKIAYIDDVDAKRTYQTIYRSEFRPSVGDKIRIEAMAAGFDTAVAETRIPAPPVIERVDTTTVFTVEPLFKTLIYGTDYYPPGTSGLAFEKKYRNMRLNISIDASTEAGTRFFQVKLLQNLSEGYVHSLPLYTKDDPVFANNPKNSILDAFFEKNISYTGFSVFTNELFKNNKHTLSVSTSNYYRVEIKGEGEAGYRVTHSPIQVTVLSLSPEIFRHIKSKERGMYDEENELGVISEPAVTFTNVQNGLGLVGAVSSVNAEIVIPPFPGGENVFPRQ